MKIVLVCMALVAVCVAARKLEPYNTTLDSFEVQSAIKEINDYYNDDLTRVPIEIVNSSKRLPSGGGTSYQLSIKYLVGEKSEVCHITVWSRPWLSGEDAAVTDFYECVEIWYVKRC